MARTPSKKAKGTVKDAAAADLAKIDKTTGAEPGKRARKTTPSPSYPPLVVGIGASAGGLRSITAFLKALPPTTEMSIVFVQHLDRDQSSNLAALLAASCALPVAEIKDGTQVQRGHVYVAPPAHDVILKASVLGLRLRQKRAAIDGQVDKFFCSLAACYGAHAVAVVLSGTGHDGTEGARAIKDAGGLVFAEAHSSAEYYGMPSSAILANAVHHVLPPDEIARKLVRVSGQTVRANGPPARPSSLPESKDQPVLDKLFEVLKDSRSVDFKDYKPSTLRRRITRRMVLRRISSLQEYVDLLRRDSKEVDDLFRDLLINVTGFFRDKSVFRALGKDILPEIIAGKQDGDSLRIWVPGCATGEEVYSIGICVSEALSKANKQLKVQIFGTDLSDWAITRARSGLYSAAAVAAVSVERQRRFFDRIEGNFRIRRSVRELCTFAQQNLCEDPPFSRMDIISCRNVMIYLGPKLQRKCVPIFYYALNPRGILMLGISETIGSFADLFTLMDKKNKIYRKKTAPLVAERRLKDLKVTEPKLPPAIPHVKLPSKPETVHTEKDTSLDIQTAADHLILTHFAPCGVVIDTRMQVWHFRGYTAPFLEHSPGAASLNILKLVRHAMAPDLSAAIHQALKTGSGVRKECLVGDGHFAKSVSMEVIPFNVGTSPEQWLLVVFDYAPVAIPLPLDGQAGAPESVYAREVERLRAELAATKDSLQSIIEEQEAANEEIKSANEEIESSNEELQSTNEELETAKEELQSTNEELSTVNEELNQRNQEINEINNDLNNLLGSIDIAIVMVDDSLTIRRTTPLAAKLFNIIPTDIGRKLKDINPNIEMPMLPKMIRSVLDNLTPVQKSIFSGEGQEYSLRVRPYRTRENVINGVVITLVDIHNPSKTAAGAESND